MSSIISVDSALVKNDGVRFCEYAQELRGTITKIDDEIGAITSGGLEGKANSALTHRYIDIKESALNFSNLIHRLGMEIQNISARTANSDEESAQSINNIGL